MKEVWPDNAVEEDTVRQNAAKVRSALRRLFRDDSFDYFPCVDKGSGFTAYAVVLR